MQDFMATVIIWCSIHDMVWAFGQMCLFCCVPKPQDMGKNLEASYTRKVQQTLDFNYLGSIIRHWLWVVDPYLQEAKFLSDGYNQTHSPFRFSHNAQCDMRWGQNDGPVSQNLETVSSTGHSVPGISRWGGATGMQQQHQSYGA